MGHRRGKTQQTADAMRLIAAHCGSLRLIAAHCGSMWLVADAPHRIGAAAAWPKRRDFAAEPRAPDPPPLGGVRRPAGGRFNRHTHTHTHTHTRRYSGRYGPDRPLPCGSLRPEARPAADQACLFPAGNELHAQSLLRDASAPDHVRDERYGTREAIEV